MSQEGRSSSTDRQARIRAAKVKRALFKGVLLLALLAIFGVAAKNVWDRWNNQTPPDFLAEIDAKDPIKRDPQFDPSKVTLPPAGTAATDTTGPTPPTGSTGPTTPILPTTPKNYVDDPWAKETLARAEDLYKGLLFADGAKLLQPASAKAISPDLMKKMVDLRRRCEEFPRAVQHIPPLTMAGETNEMQLWDVSIGQGEYFFNIAKGQDTGVLYGEAIMRRTPVSAGSMKLSFDPNENNVLAKKISRDDLLKEFRDYFHNVEKQSGLIADPNTCYDLVYLAHKMCLGAEELKYLEIADKMCQQENAHIDNVFRDRCISLALERAVFYDNLNQRKPAERILKEMVDSLEGYPRAQKEADDLKEMWKRFEGKKQVSTIRMVKETAQAPEKVEDDGGLEVGPIKITDAAGQTTNVATDTEKKPSGGGAAANAARKQEEIAFDDIGGSGGNNGAKMADKIAEADRLFREGIAHMRKGTNMQGGADNQAEMHQAADKLNRAADLYDAAADANRPTNKSLASTLTARAAEAGQFAYGMEKRQTLDFYSTYKKR